jgi:hypothetical protein
MGWVKMSMGNVLPITHLQVINNNLNWHGFFLHKLLILYYFCLFVKRTLQVLFFFFWINQEDNIMDSAFYIIYWFEWWILGRASTIFWMKKIFELRKIFMTIWTSFTIKKTLKAKVIFMWTPSHCIVRLFF